MKSKHSIFLSLVITLVILMGFKSFFNSPTPSGWYQQFPPNLNGRSIQDMIFIDSLTGYAVTNSNGQNDTAFILKTTNGGNNWFINYSRTAWFTGFKQIKFINSTTGFVCGVSVYYQPYGLTKTTNGGINWFDLNIPDPFVSYIALSVFSPDTIWLTGCNGFYDVVWRTTNGGTNWQEQLTWGSLQNTNIYMYNSRIGLACLYFPAGLWKTTNGGLNWFNIANKTFSYMYFIDSLNGWKATGALEKTTDGGYNWVTQVMPSGGYIFSNQVLQFSCINKDTIWGVGGYMQFEYPPLRLRGIIYRTTNGGLNWGFQIPDTHSVTCSSYSHVNFINKNNGWVYNGYVGAHTVTGGDTVIYYGIQQLSNNIPKDYILKQNYPNPFNPRTIIPYSIKSAANVKLIAYDILGKQVQIMVDQYQKSGEYEVDFMGKFSATGVYFYRMIVDDKVVDTKKMILIK